MSWGLQRDSLLRQPAPLSVYQHLSTFYALTPHAEKEESLNALPQSIRRKLFDNINELAGQPPGSDYGRIHIFKSLSRLQLAVQKVALDLFRSLTPDQRREIVEGVWLRGSFPNVDDLSQLENYVADNPPLLLKIMHGSLGDLTPELQQSLTTWIGEGGPEEKRAVAGDVIIDFLRNPENNKIDLQFLGLTSLPPIFGCYPFVLRLEELNLSHNNLATLPEQIGKLGRLKVLDLSFNHTLHKLPIGMLRLPNACEVNIENTRILELILERLPGTENLDPILEIDVLKDLLFYFLFPGDLTAELEQILTTWVAEGLPDEQRPEAGNRIIEFLKDTEKNELVLAGLGLRSLPPIFDSLPFILRLNRLDLSDNRLTAVPKQIGRLRNLRALALNYNQLILLPEEICQLENLQYLSAINNRLAALPENIGRLRQLHFLQLEGNYLNVLPEKLGQLERLHSLCLNDNQLTYLPEKIGELKNLRILNLSSNLNLRQFPNGLLELSNDCEVNIENTQLFELAHHSLRKIPIPSSSTFTISAIRRHSLFFPFPGDLTFEIEQILSIWEREGEPGELKSQAKNRVINFLRNTQENELSFNGLGLKSLPPIFDYPPLVSRLRNLILSYNDLSLLPEEIGLLENLIHLSVDNNRLTVLSKQIGYLQNLEYLSLNNNQLTALPEQIGHLRNLEHLDLDNNQLIRLPELIGWLQSLKKLLLKHNQLILLPKQIGLLNKLSSLQIDNNRLTGLPETINGLWNLRELTLSGNQLTTLPKEIEGLCNLRKLDLSSNTNLKKLPIGFFELPDDCKVDIQSTWLSEYVSDYLRSNPNMLAPFGPVLGLDMLKARFPLALFWQMHPIETNNSNTRRRSGRGSF